MPKYVETDWYHLPLYYDIVYDPDTEPEAEFLHLLAKRYVDGPARAVLEPACGTGRLMAALGRRGLDVAGFDISQPMIEFAERRLTAAGLDASVTQQRMEAFHCESTFDFAHCLVSSFKYLLSEADAQAHLQRVASVLRPGGVYALGLHLTDYDQTTRQRERWVGERDGIRVTNNLQSWPPDASTRREQLRSRLIVEQDEQVHRYETHWAFRTYSAAQLEALLAKVPSLEHIETFDFHYEINEPTTLHGPGLDKIVVLKRHPDG